MAAARSGSTLLLQTLCCCAGIAPAVAGTGSGDDAGAGDGAGFGDGAIGGCAPPPVNLGVNPPNGATWPGMDSGIHDCKLMDMRSS